MTTSNCDKIIMTQEELLKERMSGKLPVIDIVGHPFYVDVRWGMLRPKDDFHTMGIPIKAFDDFEGPDDFTWLPYDPKNHELKIVDFEKITSIPNDWIIVEIPFPWKLDPYGYARENGFDIEEELKENPIQANLKARVVAWKETAIPEIIARNKANPQAERKRRHKPPDNVTDPSGKTQGPKR